MVDVANEPEVQIEHEEAKGLEAQTVKEEKQQSIDDVLAENAKLKSTLIDLEAGTDVNKLKERVAHKEGVILDVQSKNKQLVEENASYKVIVESIIKDLSDGVDKDWLEEIADLPVTKQLSLLRKLKQEPSAPQKSKVSAPTAMVGDAVSSFEARIAKLKSDPKTTVRDWEILRNEMKNLK